MHLETLHCHCQGSQHHDHTSRTQEKLREWLELHSVRVKEHFVVLSFTSTICTCICDFCFEFECRASESC